MTKVIVTLAIGVGLVGALKTGLALEFLVPQAQQSPTLIVGLFISLCGVTASVAAGTLYCFRAHFEDQSPVRPEPVTAHGITKEAVIQRHARQWGLSQAESDVALFVAKGFSNAEVADMRGCAIATVKSQLGSIYQKSGLETRYQLMAFVTDEVCTLAQTTDTPMADVSNVTELPVEKKRRRSAVDRAADASSAIDSPLPRAAAQA
ncbi:helix-turn-helix transcriptional regulator [Gymnodinialimonas ceratoperidinii]|uniref:Helix-turn-helix transcriptional regulator n=1 Tax=Gymnodinialimonas ceratoperidinii TaxID=2856823 RepID=A0A8F6TSY6_9RHOB|nr:helix-turn-helix transcriptional regulator [Gymnodinialimonas ceratoperidinii]QXT38165.1 helix-turn-helix transcriptional regulator [Gymnodinialimonas ceratoperidinii]